MLRLKPAGLPYDQSSALAWPSEAATDILYRILAFSLKILIISSSWPWPLEFGGSVAQFGWIDYLRHRHQITLLTPANSEAALLSVEKLRVLWPEVNLLTVARPQSSGKITVGGAIKKVIRNLPLANFLFRSLRRDVNRGPSPCPGSKLLPALPNHFVRTAASEALQNYDLIQVEYVEMLSIIHVLPKHVPNLFSEIEIHYVVRDRARTNASRADVYENYLYSQEKAYEIDTLRRYDAIVTMSEHDRRLLKAELPESEIHASPFAYVHSPGKLAGCNISAFSDRIVYVGSNQHSPNVDAVQWFLEAVWPALSEKYTKLSFHVIGTWSPESRKPFESTSRVVFTGFVEDVADVLQGAIMVVPLRVGSGIRTKILMAMTLGVPIVTTKVGVEGIDATDGNEFLCQDDAEGFAAAVGRLIDDQPLRERIAKGAFAFVQSKFSPEATGACRDAIYHVVHAKHAGVSTSASSDG